MASRSKKKKPNNLPKQDAVVQKKIENLEKEKKALNLRLSGIIALALLVMVVFLLTVPVVEATMTVDLKAFADKIEQETGVENTEEIENQTIKLKLTSLELLMAPAQADGNTVKYLVDKLGLSEIEQGKQFMLELTNSILTEQEKQNLNASGIILVTLSYTMLALIVLSMVVALIERNKMKQGYLGTFILSGAMTFVVFFEFIFEIVMLIMATKNASVSVAWGIFLMLVFSGALFGYIIYHHLSLNKITLKEKENEKMS